MFCKTTQIRAAAVALSLARQRTLPISQQVFFNANLSTKHFSRWWDVFFVCDRFDDPFAGTVWEILVASGVCVMCGFLCSSALTADSVRVSIHGSPLPSYEVVVAG